VNASVRVTLTTADAPGAIALLQLQGPGTRDVLMRTLKPGDSSARAFAPGRLHLVNIADVDRGLAVLLRDDWAQLMPHGGPRVVEKLIEQLTAAGAVYDARPDARQMYPEATSDLEADMLAAIARAASPAAIDLLLAQPRLWRDALASQQPLPGDILERSRILDRLIDPPTVVVVGQPNVGKSTLTNRMLGRSVSVVADLPGTTRDWVAGLAELQTPGGGVAVRWLDTPGLRHSDDAIEQQAIELARSVIAQADVVIAMRDAEHNWPDADALPRRADLRVVNKIDLAMDDTMAGDVRLSAIDGTNIDVLERRVLEVLQLHGVEPALWAFSDRLRTMVTAAGC
jgi:tRNA modification GTPase